jgi:hypothetical protein
MKIFIYNNIFAEVGFKKWYGKKEGSGGDKMKRFRNIKMENNTIGGGV